ncbi:MAG: DUF2029 domain-containing protein [Deltaproteobacteria bacterium]|nr:DUF2029 domain-containing protein [Deltaproteobacteria bacterium]
MAERKTVFAVLACATAVAVVSTWAWTQHIDVPGAPHVPRYALQDFRDVVYYPPVALCRGDNPYDRPRYRAAYPIGDGLSLYSPLTILLHAPIALLPCRAAEFVYFVTSVALTLALGALALVLCGVPLTIARVAGLGAALIFSRPGHWNLFNGQVTLEVVIPMLVALWCARDRPLLAGVALAITTLKPTYGLPLAALLAARGEWRTVLVGGVVAGALTTLVLVRLVAAAGGVAPFAATIQATYESSRLEPRKLPQHSPFRIDVVALAGRVLGRSPSNAETFALTLGTLAVAAPALRRLRARRGARERDARLHAASVACLAVVACAYHQQYDLLVLTLPLVVLFWRVDAWPWRDHPALRRVAFALVVLLLVNYLGSGTAAAALGLPEKALLVASSLDNLALLALLAIFVATAWRDPRATVAT